MKLEYDPQTRVLTTNFGKLALRGSMRGHPSRFDILDFDRGARPWNFVGYSQPIIRIENHLEFWVGCEYVGGEEHNPYEKYFVLNAGNVSTLRKRCHAGTDGEIVGEGRLSEVAKLPEEIVRAFSDLTELAKAQYANVKFLDAKR